MEIHFMEYMEYIFLRKNWEMGMWFLKYSKEMNAFPISLIFVWRKK